MKLTHEQITLIANALFEKSNGDRDAALEVLRDNVHLEPARLALTLRKQAAEADDLANAFMNATAVDVRDGAP